MKVLFVGSGNHKDGMNPIVKSQADSISKSNIEISFFLISNRGLGGYLKSILQLRGYLKRNTLDLIHAHYSLSAFVSALGSNGIPVIASLMGSDIHLGRINNLLIKFFAKTNWKVLIVKTKEMQSILKLKEAFIIPNGINLDKFTVIDRIEARQAVHYDKNKKYVLFLSNPKRLEKNFNLAKSSFELIKVPNVYLDTVYDIEQELVPFYLNAADVLLSTSLREGSPNIIKEAMACNIPIVSTHVGDVRWLFGDTEGHFITSFEPEDVAKKITHALNFGKRTNGRQRIVELGLNSGSVAKRIIDIYRAVLKN